MKICRLCNKRRRLSNFYKKVGGRDGTSSWCKACQGAKNKIHRKNNEEYYTNYRIETKEYQKKKNKEWANNNRKYLNEKVNNWYKKQVIKISDVYIKRRFDLPKELFHLIPECRNIIKIDRVIKQLETPKHQRL